MSVSHARPLPPPEPVLNRLVPIRLPSYKELAAVSNCDEALPGTSGRSGLFSGAAGPIRLPPLEVPSTPRTKSNDEKTRDRFINLAARCPPPDDASHTGGEDPRPERQRISHPHSLWGQSGTNGYGGWPRVPLSLRDTTSAVVASYTASPPRAHDSNDVLGHPSASQQPQTHLGHIHLSPASPTGSHGAFTTSAALLAQMLPQPLKFSHANAKAEGRTKKQALSCYFCRERKIACGRPEGGVGAGACNQCVRRKQPCTYPTISHRGQHSRIRSAARRAGVREVDVRNALEPGRISLSPPSESS